MKKLLPLLFSFLFLINLPVVNVFSQSPSIQTGSDSAEEESSYNLPEGVSSCFQYYDFGKVIVNLTPDKGSYQPNDKIKLHGTIANNNTFPIIDVILYSQLRRINDFGKSQYDNGDYLIDRIALKDNLSFLPHETKYIDVEVPVQPTYPAGNYKIEYYIFSKESFHYSGRAFLEGSIAGFTSFVISNNIAQIYFDINNFKVNGIKTNLRTYGSVFNNSTFNFEIPIVDNRTNKTDLDAKVKYYYFEDDLESLLGRTETVTVKPDNQVIRTSFTIPTNLAAAYVLVAEIDQPTKTIFKFRFYKDGTIAKELRINDLGITDYPLVDTSQAFLCFHSPATAPAPLTEVKLSILDNSNNLIDKK